MSESEGRAEEERRGTVRGCSYGLNNSGTEGLASSAPTPTRQGAPLAMAAMASPGSQEQDRTRVRLDYPYGPPGATQYQQYGIAPGACGGINFGGGAPGMHAHPSVIGPGMGYNAGYMPPQQAPLQMPPVPDFMMSEPQPQYRNIVYGAGGAQVRAGPRPLSR